MIGALQYFYLFYISKTGGAHIEYTILNLEDFIYYISGSRFRSRMLTGFSNDHFFTYLPYFAQLVWREFSFSLLFIPLGIKIIKDKLINNFLFISCFSYLIFILNYNIHDIFVYLIPVYMVISLWICLGIWSFSSLIFYKIKHKYILQCLIIFLAPCSLLYNNYKELDNSQNTYFHKEIKNVIEKIDSDALIIMDIWKSNYNYAEGLLYFLLGEEEYKKRNIYIINHLKF